MIHYLIHACLIFLGISHKKCNHESRATYSFFILHLFKNKNNGGRSSCHVEHMEKAHQVLQEKHVKTQEDISQIMEMLVTLTKGKKNVKAANPQPESTPLRSTNEDPLYP